MYKNKTIEEVYNLLINSFQEKFNRELKILPRSFVAVLCKVLAGIFIVLYKMCGWFYLQIFPDTADFNEVTIQGQKIRPLVKLGVLFGEGEPKFGKPWNGKIQVAVIRKGVSLAQGIQLKSDLTGLVYLVSENNILENDTEIIKVHCAERGEAGTLADGEVLKFVNPLGFVAKEAEVIATTQFGTEDEKEQNYRARVERRYWTQPQGGALSDYRIWASDVAGCGQVYPYNAENSSPSGVLLYVAGDPAFFPNRIPSDELLRLVGEACTYDPKTGMATRKPMTATLDPALDGSYSNIMPCRVTGFRVAINGMTGAAASDFGAALKLELEIFFNNKEPYIRGLSLDNNRSDFIYKNSVVAVANNVAVGMKATFDGVEIRLEDNEEISSYQLGRGELAALAELVINGEAYDVA